ncbi:cyclophilin-like fold protein [Streptomyces sp. NPDC096311]
MNPSVGDLTYCAPWGNPAIFYRDFDYGAVS